MWKCSARWFLQHFSFLINLTDLVDFSHQDGLPFSGYRPRANNFNLFSIDSLPCFLDGVHNSLENQWIADCKSNHTCLGRRQMNISPSTAPHLIHFQNVRWHTAHIRSLHDLTRNCGKRYFDPCNWVIAAKLYESMQVRQCVQCFCCYCLTRLATPRYTAGSSPL